MKNLKNLLVVFILLGAVSASLPALAQNVLVKSDKTQKLQNLNHEIESRKKRQQALQKEAGALKRQRDKLQQRIIALARDLQNIDAERDRLEERIYNLAVAESQLDAQLQKDRVALSQALAGLQALQVEPPPAFAVHPNDALAAVQGTILLAGVVPSMQGRARDLRDRLTEMAAIRRRMDKQSAALIVAEQDAANARQSLNTALAKKARAEKKARAAAQAEARAIARLVAQARDLRDLANKLAQQQAANNAASNGGFAPEVGKFSAAKGLLPLPVAGRILTFFGQPTPAGHNTQGLSIAARPGAQITAPYDGRILYGGPFRQYGGIVILAVDGRYQMILAGIEAPQVYAGQDILAGEPLGNLPPENSLLRAVSRQPSQLYLELRFDGKPIDPTPWLRPSAKSMRPAKNS